MQQKLNKLSFASYREENDSIRLAISFRYSFFFLYMLHVSLECLYRQLLLRDKLDTMSMKMVARLVKKEISKGSAIT